MPDDEFGYTAWGMDWVRLAQPLRQTRPEPLLPRARSIARNGGVTIAIEDRIVRATIHRGGQASVTYIEVAPLTRTAADSIAALLPDATGILSDELHQAISAAGTSPAPVIASTDCSCPARSAHCVHVLAVYYAMARQVDDQPRIALEIQDYFRAVQGGTNAPEAASRWTAISALDPAGYFG